jgi:hypothetical protein
MGLLGGKKQTVGYKYYIGMHMAICHGPVDAVTQITVGDRVAWSGNVTSTQDITVSAEELFGGEKREGGVSGTVGVKFGEAAQAQDSYLAAQLGSNCPSFRGVLSFVLKQCYIGNNPYLKNWAFTVKRLPAKGWYDAKRDIGGHANPAHIVYEALTNRDWGMGYPAAALDDAQFKAAADVLYSEGFGLSLVWNQQSPVHEFVGHVLDHIGAVLRMSLSTGLFQLKLIRDDYTPSSLPLLNESNVVSLDSYQRAAWGETVNEIVLKYTTADEKDASITVQDLGNIQIQGGVVSETVEYPGIRSDTIALRVAMRDLKIKSTPLSRVKLTVNRQAWNLHPGDVFRLSWSRLGLSEVVYRVGAVQGGTLQDGKIVIEAAEDIFGLPTNSYAAQQPVGWVSPNNAPAAAPYRLVYEAPYWDLVRAMGDSDAQALPSDAGYLVAAAVRPSGDAHNFELRTRIGSAAYTEQDTGEFCPSCTTTAELVQEVSSTINYAGGVDMDLVGVGDYAIINGTEWVAVTGINLGANSITVDRGILDTVPAAHASGVRIFFPYDYNAFDQTQRILGETVNAKMLPATGMGTLAEASAPVDNLTMAQRQVKPYPPGNVKINGARWPAVITGELSVSWSHRSRTQQTAGFTKQDAGNIGPESGQTYTLRLYGETGALKRTVSGLSGTSYTWATESDDSGLTVPGDDPHWDKIALGLHCDGADGATTFIDVKGHTITANGNAQVDTAQSKFGGASALFDGTGDYLSSPNSADFAFGSGDFTVELWARFSAQTAHQGLISFGWTSGGYGPWLLFYNQSLNQILFYSSSNGTSWDISSAVILNTPALNTWYHLAVAREGNSIRLFTDGVLAATVTTSATLVATGGTLNIGGDSAGAFSFNGHLDDIRITKGVARYTVNFTPPSAEFPSGAPRLNGTVRVELESVRSGYTSMQKHSIQFDRTGYGYNYGKYYGGV